MLCQAKGDRVDEDEKLSPAEAAPTLSPAGTFVLDAATGKPAAGSLPVDFCRSLDHDGPDGRGRYLVAVNSGYGLQFDGRTNLGQQSLAVIDLNAKPAPAVVQNIYFPTPQSACVGAVFALPAPDGTVELYVSGGFENKVWRFLLTPGDKSPVSPGSPGPDTKVAAPFIDLASLAAAPATRRYNAGKAAVYPLGLALGGDRLLAANDLDDSVGVVQFPRGNPATPALARVDLRRQPDENVYPYAVAALPRQRADRADAVKVYVLLWNAAAVAVFEWPPPPAKLSPGTPDADQAPPPALSILRLSNDHTSGLAAGQPSPQFYVADNDYALGRLVEAVSKSPFWEDTAIVAVEDDAQDGPDHVDCHRSVALVISAYNRPGALIHHCHTTAGFVRTIEELLGLPPMNAQDAAATPFNAFRDGPPDLAPYVASLPQLETEKLVTPRAETVADPEVAAATRRSATLDLDHADGDDPAVLNAVIWSSVRGSQPLPAPHASAGLRSPAFCFAWRQAGRRR